MVSTIREKLGTLGDWSYSGINKHTSKFIKHESEVLQDQDPEELHQMRVGMRRLRSAVTGFSICLELPESANDKNIGKIARILGKLRDLDVLLEILNQQYLPDLPHSEQKKLNKLINKLHKKRLKTFKLVEKTLQGKKYQKLKKSLIDWLENPVFNSYLGQVEISLILPDLLLPEVSKLLLHSGWIVGTESEANELFVNQNLPEEKVENILVNQGVILHDLRKEAKRCRYQMELFAEFYGDNYQDAIRDIKKLQTVLGDLQDDAVLMKILGKYLGDNLEEKMPVLNKLIRDNRYQQWQKWQELQLKFLQKSTRQQLHKIILGIEEKEINQETNPPENSVPQETQEVQN